ncbi:SMI1/KNR4 family protein [Paenibacillus sp. UNC451MF]|uniref:SMI1/KNR4 family protein n=1 Tax=Paenibacillus sp. UNC451MF TaxID=1449063 RepID=UPI00048F677B|nr:SMI1/KNR4 family protein [Paenibacillus sp. UNC451MF]
MWNNLFETEYVKGQEVTPEEIQQFLTTWNEKLSEAEVDEIVSRQSNPFPVSHELHSQYQPFDPTLWVIPQKQLPASYIEFLKYSNGGEFQNGERYFQFFSTNQFREYNLAYELPEYMEAAVSFAMDGCGNHYLFDMREDMKHNEYPILVAHSGYLDYEGCVQVANSFLELCTGRTSMDDEMNKRWE